MQRTTKATTYLYRVHDDFLNREHNMSFYAPYDDGTQNTKRFTWRACQEKWFLANSD